VDIIFKGVGGHGAYPHKTIDPVVMAARAILDFQTIVSREIMATNPAVITVGAIHGGTQYNIIPDEVKLQLTIRTYDTEVKDHIIEALNRISKHVALSARMPEDKLPEVIELKDPTPPVVNDAELVKKGVVSFKNILGNDNVFEVPTSMAGEDFGRYGLTEEKIPISLFWLGSVNPDKYAEAQKQGTELHPLHSPYFCPDPGPTLRTGAYGMTRAIIDLMGK
jgi:hippurate hydrolase